MHFTCTTFRFVIVLVFLKAVETKAFSMPNQILCCWSYPLHLFNSHTCQLCGDWYALCLLAMAHKNVCKLELNFKPEAGQSCKLSIDAARNRATRSCVYLSSCASLLPCVWVTLPPFLSVCLSDLLYLLVCHTVCHIIWTITNHASVKQTKRAQSIRSRIRIRTRTRTRKWLPHFTAGQKFASKSYFRIRGALTQRQNYAQSRKRENLWGREQNQAERTTFECCGRLDIFLALVLRKSHVRYVCGCVCVVGGGEKLVVLQRHCVCGCGKGAPQPAAVAAVHTSISL